MAFQQVPWLNNRIPGMVNPATRTAWDSSQGEYQTADKMPWAQADFVPQQSAMGQPDAQPGLANPGEPHPYFQPGAWSAIEQGNLMGPPQMPGQEYTNTFLPPIMSQPFQQGIGTAMDMANWSGQAVPQAAGFQQALYSPGMTPMEQQYLGASAMLGGRQLADMANRIEGQFENSASHGSLAPALFDAANQYNQQLNQMAGQMGTQRQQMAASTLPFTMGFPIQAYQAAQEGAAGLYGMGQNAMYGDLQFPLAMFGSNTFTPASVIAQPNSSKK
jgi:hypothetical protein